TFKLDSLPLINMSVSYFPTLGTIQVIGGSESQIEMIRDYIAMNDKKTPQAYLEVQIISLSESGSKTLDNTWSYYSKNFSFNAGGGGGFSTDPMYPVFFSGKGYTLVDTESWDSEKNAYETAGKVGRWSGSSQLVYAVNYLVENKKGRVLANPRVLLTSGQTSTIDLTADYVSKVTSQYLDSGSASGSAQVQKEYEIQDDNGIKVTITPFISPDGYVTLDIKPEYKTIASQIYTTGETGEQELAVTLLQRRDLDLKGVRIKDGETLVIGGMIQETETKTVSKIPFLGDIPVVGMFFRSTNTSKEKTEMVIMLTPQIVIDTEDAVADDNML
ncbi:type II and III secretion system protein, partial [bacterium]|nr:type II and III secretion system protein [bacterium]